VLAGSLQGWDSCDPKICRLAVLRTYSAPGLMNVLKGGPQVRHERSELWRSK
jgi:hypothetical protein